MLCYCTCAQAMLQKIHFNMLVKSVRVQIKYKMQDCVISPVETSERYRRGKSDKSSKSYPGTSEKKKLVQFAHCLCKAPALINEINNTFFFFISYEHFFLLPVNKFQSPYLIIMSVKIQYRP